MKVLSGDSWLKVKDILHQEMVHHVKVSQSELGSWHSAWCCVMILMPFQYMHLLSLDNLKFQIDVTII